MLSFSSYGWLTVMAFLDQALLKTETPIVGYPDTYRFDPYCRTALGVQRDLVKSLSTLYHSLHRHLATCGIDGHAQLFISLLQHACILVASYPGARGQEIRNLFSSIGLGTRLAFWLIIS